MAFQKLEPKSRKGLIISIILLIIVWAGVVVYILLKIKRKNVERVIERDLKRLKKQKAKF